MGSPLTLAGRREHSSSQVRSHTFRGTCFNARHETPGIVQWALSWLMARVTADERQDKKKNAWYRKAKIILKAFTAKSFRFHWPRIVLHDFKKTDGTSPPFATVPVMVFAVELRLLTTLSMVASCFKKNGRITRVYKILEPFHCTGAMHQIRNKHWRESTWINTINWND